MPPVGASEFFAMKGWIVDRWPQASRLRPSQWAAYLEELEDSESDDVWGALHLYFENDSPHPPSVNKLKTLIGEIVTTRARRVNQAALPASEPVNWTEQFRNANQGRSPSEAYAESINEAEEVI